MGAMTRAGTLALVLLGLLVLGACATATSSPPPSPRQGARCLSDPREKDTRPLFFFFCIES